jgi:hypothetical protein
MPRNAISKPPDYDSLNPVSGVPYTVMQYCNTNLKGRKYYQYASLMCHQGHSSKLIPEYDKQTRNKYHKGNIPRL